MAAKSMRTKPKTREDAVQKLAEHTERMSRVRELKIGKGDEVTYLYLVSAGDGLMTTKPLTPNHQELLRQFAKLFLVVGCECFLDRVSGEEGKVKSATTMAALVAEYHQTFEQYGTTAPQEDEDEHSGQAEGAAAEAAGEEAGPPRRKDRVSAHEVSERLGGVAASPFAGGRLLTPEDPAFEFAQEVIGKLEGEGLGFSGR